MISKDKYAHFAISLLMVAVLSLFVQVWLAMLLSLVVGLAKELVYDKWLGKGTFDVYDILADLAGIIVGSGVGCIIKACI